MEISKQGIDLIKSWESFRAEAYLCPAGVPTIGYGHTRTASIGQPVISILQAELMLRSDLTLFEVHLRQLLKDIELKQCQYDAVVSFCYNLGTGAFKNSNAYHAMKLNPNSKHIADSWITFRNAGGKYLRGLMLRRLDELTLYYSS